MNNIRLTDIDITYKNNRNPLLDKKNKHDRYLDIIKMISQGKKPKDIAFKYGITRQAVRYIILNKNK